MTQYIRTIEIDDSESITIEAALNHFLEVCEEEISKGSGAPYYAHRSTITEFLKKLNGRNNITQITTNSIIEDKMNLIFKGKKKK